MISNIHEQFTNLRNLKTDNVIIDVNCIQQLLEASYPETYIPATTAEIIKRNVQTFKDICAAADPFGVVDTVNYINDKTNQLIKQAADSVENKIKIIDQSFDNLLVAGQEITVAIKVASSSLVTVTLIVDNLLIEVSDLLTQLNNLGADIIAKSDELFNAIADLAINGVKATNGIYDFFKKYGLAIVLSISAILGLFIFMKMRRRNV